MRRVIGNDAVRDEPPVHPDATAARTPVAEAASVADDAVRHRPAVRGNEHVAARTPAASVAARQNEALTTDFIAFISYTPASIAFKLTRMIPHVQGEKQAESVNCSSRALNAAKRC